MVEDDAMMTLSMLSLGLVILLAAITVLSVVATQPTLRPVPCGSSFGFEPTAPTSADTLQNARHSEQTLGDWHTADLHSLFEVETLLDSLEASNATKTEVELASNDHFVVRWR